jgi:hypothetical protein
MVLRSSTRFQLIRFNPIGRGADPTHCRQPCRRFQLIRFNPIGRGISVALAVKVLA